MWHTDKHATWKQSREWRSPSYEYAYCTYTDLQHTRERTICHRPPHESRMHTTEHKASHTKPSLSHLLPWLFGTFKTQWRGMGKRTFLERSYLWPFPFCFLGLAISNTDRHALTSAGRRQFKVSATKASDVLLKSKYDSEMQIPEASVCCGWNVWSGLGWITHPIPPPLTANVPVAICALLSIYHNSGQGTGANTRNKQKKIIKNTETYPCSIPTQSHESTEAHLKELMSHYQEKRTVLCISEVNQTNICLVLPTT